MINKLLIKKEQTLNNIDALEKQVLKEKVKLEVIEEMLAENAQGAAVPNEEATTPTVLGNI